jgi:hypothetical protein
LKFAKDMTTQEISEAFLRGLKSLAVQRESNIYNGCLNPKNVEFIGIITRVPYPSGQGGYASVSAAAKIVSLTVRGNVDRRVLKRVLVAMEDLMTTRAFCGDDFLLTSKPLIEKEIREMRGLLAEKPRNKTLWC